jgi:hypothetical protein
VVEKTRSGPAFDRISAEKSAAERAAKEAALREILRWSEALDIPIVHEESGRVEPENVSPFQGQSGAALSLVTLGVLAFQQRRPRNQTADESDRRTD